MLYRYKLSLHQSHVQWLLFLIITAITLFSGLSVIHNPAWAINQKVDVLEIISSVSALVWLIWVIILAVNSATNSLDTEPLFEKVYIERPKGLVFELIKKKNEEYYCIRAKLKNWTRYFGNGMGKDINDSMSEKFPTWMKKENAEAYYDKLIALHTITNDNNNNDEMILVKSSKPYIEEYNHKRASLLLKQLIEADDKGEDNKLILKELEKIHRI